ncbi:hypothetical protein GC170_13325 [bacterium]|nr:hypothetical protein [bacterium]
MSERFASLPKILAEIADLGQVQERYGLEGGPEDVNRQIENALVLFPNHGVALAARGWTLLARGEFVQAIGWFTRAIESDAGDDLKSEWLGFRGGCRFKTGDWKNALADQVEARDLTPTNPRVHVVLAMTFREIGDRLSAMLCYVLAGYFGGEIPRSELFEKLVKDPAFADPERIEASLCVLADPLDKHARVVRAEAMAAIEHPSAAVYDLKMADSLAPGDLGVMVRIEDFQLNGVFAGGPVYEVASAELPAGSCFAGFLAEFEREYRTRLLPREIQPLAFPVERVFGPSRIVPPEEPLAAPLHSILAGSVATLVFAAPALALALSNDAIPWNSPAAIPLVPADFRFAAQVGLMISGAALLALTSISLVFGCFWYVAALQRVQESLTEKYPRCSLLWGLAWFAGFIYGMPFYLVFLFLALTLPIFGYALALQYAPQLTGVATIFVVAMSFGHLTGFSQTSPYHPSAQHRKGQGG